MHFLVGNNGSTEAMTILNSGNIGIGTAAPLTTLDVRGNIYLKQANSIIFGANNLSAIENYQSIAGDTSANDLTFRTYRDFLFNTNTSDGGAGTTRLAIKQTTGNVGIGTSTPATLFSVATSTNIFNVTSAGNVGVGISAPTTKLHVLGTTEQLRLDYGGDNYTSFTVGSNGALTIDPSGSSGVTSNGALTVASPFANAVNLQFGGTVYLALNDTANSTVVPRIGAAANNLIFLTDQTGGGAGGSATSERMRISDAGVVTVYGTTTLATTAGNVGIGTTVPSSTLHVVGTFRASATSTFEVNTIIGSTNTPSSTLHVVGTARTTATTTLATNGTTNVGIGTSTPSSFFTIATSTNMVTVGLDGSVVIGAPTGGAKGYGTLNAQAVYDDNTLLTDYVFEKYYLGAPKDEKHANYTLLSLSEAEEYTKQALHLPTITGRDEWEAKGGLSLGKLASELWETVETDFLYITELNSRLEALEQANGCKTSDTSDTSNTTYTCQAMTGDQLTSADPTTDLTVRSLVVSQGLSVKGQLSLSADSVGRARIDVGDEFVRVDFEQDYGSEPVVTISPRGEAALNQSFRYAIIDESGTGFTIKISEPAESGLEFNWHAFWSVEPIKISVSKGGNTVEISQPEADETSLNLPTGQAGTSEIDGNTAGGTPPADEEPAPEGEVAGAAATAPDEASSSPAGDEDISPIGPIEEGASEPAPAAEESAPAEEPAPEPEPTPEPAPESEPESTPAPTE